MPDNATPLLDYVKSAMLISGVAQDAALETYINEVKVFLADAGVAKAVIESDEARGVIVRGVIDLWNYGAGEARLSEYFIQRAIQLAAIEGGDDANV